MRVGATGSRLRWICGLTVAAALVGGVPSVAQAAPRSRGTLFVFESPDCTGGGNAPKVMVPFSVGGRDYPPNTAMEAFATDMATGEVFGPFVLTTNEDGAFCALVPEARATQWKIDLVEPGSGFTDSKVVTVLEPPPGPTTTEAATTTAAATTTTQPATTTTVPAATTTVPGSTTIAATTTTSAATTTTTGQATTTSVDSEAVPPIDFVPVPVPPEWSLPSTGAGGSATVVWGAASLGVGALLILATRRRPPVAIRSPRR